jgi:hypothetical protein
MSNFGAKRYQAMGPKAGPLNVELSGTLVDTSRRKKIIGPASGSQRQLTFAENGQVVMVRDGATLGLPNAPNAANALEYTMYVSGTIATGSYVTGSTAIYGTITCMSGASMVADPSGSTRGWTFGPSSSAGDTMKVIALEGAWYLTGYVSGSAAITLST